MGKLITYASGKSAEIIIWVVKHAREEHIAAIEWLNNHTDEKVGFFLCEIKLYKIGDSEPAVKFEVIEKPNDWAKGIRRNDSINETQQQRLNFSIGSSACHISITQVRKRNEVSVELYIDDNKELFKSLLTHKNDIESISGLTFDWRELPLKKASRILIQKSADLGDKSKWNEQFDWLIDVVIKMKAAFKKYL